MATKRIDIALPAALIFALHGTRPEAVTWTAGRFDVLAGFFALSALFPDLRVFHVGLGNVGQAEALADIVLCDARGEFFDLVVDQPLSFGGDTAAAACIVLFVFCAQAADVRFELRQIVVNRGVNRHDFGEGPEFQSRSLG